CVNTTPRPRPTRSAAARGTVRGRGRRGGAMGRRGCACRARGGAATGMASAEEEGEEDVRDEQSASEEPDHGGEGGSLERGEPADGVAARAPPGVPGAKADEEPAADREEEATRCPEGRPREQLGG